MAKIYDSIILLLLILVFTGFVWLQATPTSPIHYLKQGFQNPGGSGSSSNIVPLPTRTVEINAAKKTICNLQKVFKDLRCPINPVEPKTIPLLAEMPTIPRPSVDITANIDNLSNFAVANGDLSTYVKENDMIYFGYTLDMQGPFIVKSVSFASGSTTLTFTTKYIGPNLQNSVMAIVPSSAQPTVSSGTIAVVETTGPDEVKKEVYIFDTTTGFYTLSTAETACNTFGGTVATLAQMRQAYKQGADLCKFALVKGDNGEAISALSVQGNTCTSLPAGVTAQAPGPTSSALACYGVKPPEGSFTGTSGLIKPFSPSSYNNPQPIFGYVQPGTNYITTENTVLPDTLRIGETVYIQGKCNQYDTDNGDGTCTAYDCKIGETDVLSENKCQKYGCRPKTGNQSDHIDNGDGTCTVPKEYITCPSKDDIVGKGVRFSGGFVTQENIGDTTKCTYKSLRMERNNTQHYVQGPLGWQDNTGKSGPVRWEGGGAGELGEGYNPSGGWDLAQPANTWNGGAAQARSESIADVIRTYGLKEKAYNYDIIKSGTKSTQYVKTSANPSYKYPKVLGPYAVAANPAVGKILLKSKTPGDLDANGKFASISNVWKVVAINASSITLPIPSEPTHSSSLIYSGKSWRVTEGDRPSISSSASNGWTFVLYDNGKLYSVNQAEGGYAWYESYNNTNFRQISLDGFSMTLMGIKNDNSIWYADRNIANMGYYSPPNWTQLLITYTVELANQEDGPNTVITNTATARFKYISHSNAQCVGIGMDDKIYYLSNWKDYGTRIDITESIASPKEVSFDGYNKSVAVLNTKGTVLYKKIPVDITNKVSVSFGLQNVLINKISSTENIITNMVKKGTIKNYDQCVSNGIVWDLASKNKMPGDDGAINTTRYTMCTSYYKEGWWHAGAMGTADDRKDEYKTPKGQPLTKKILGCAAGTYADGLSCIRCPAGQSSVRGGTCTACTYKTTIAGCGAYTYTVQGSGTTITGPYNAYSGTTITVTATAPGYVDFGTPTNVRWMVDGYNQFNTCTSPTTCAITIPAGYNGSITRGEMRIQMKSTYYNSPDIDIPILS